jgi:hypothetical protein
MFNFVDEYCMRTGRRGCPEDMAVIWLAQLLHTISVQVKSGIIHGDLKLENLLLDQAGNLVVCDYETSIMRDPDKAADILTNQRLTGTPLCVHHGASARARGQLRAALERGGMRRCWASEACACRMLRLQWSEANMRQLRAKRARRKVMVLRRRAKQSRANSESCRYCCGERSKRAQTRRRSLLLRRAQQARANSEARRCCCGERSKRVQTRRRVAAAATSAASARKLGGVSLLRLLRLLARLFYRCTCGLEGLSRSYSNSTAARRAR